MTELYDVEIVADQADGGTQKQLVVVSGSWWNRLAA
jgi:hypothetical protein